MLGVCLSQDACLLKQRRRKSQPSLDSRGGITGGSFVWAMWNSADTYKSILMLSQSQATVAYS